MMLRGLLLCTVMAIVGATDPDPEPLAPPTLSRAHAFYSDRSDVPSFNADLLPLSQITESSLDKQAFNELDSITSDWSTPPLDDELVAAFSDSSPPGLEREYSHYYAMKAKALQKYRRWCQRAGECYRQMVKPVKRRWTHHVEPRVAQFVDDGIDKMLRMNAYLKQLSHRRRITNGDAEDGGYE